MSLMEDIEEQPPNPAKTPARRTRPSTPAKPPTTGRGRGRAKAQAMETVEEQDEDGAEAAQELAEQPAEPADMPKRGQGRSRKEAAVPEPEQAEEAARPRRGRGKKASPEPESAAEPAPEPAEPPKRRGGRAAKAAEPEPETEEPEPPKRGRRGAKTEPPVESPAEEETQKPARRGRAPKKAETPAEPEPPAPATKPRRGRVQELSVEPAPTDDESVIDLGYVNKGPTAAPQVTTEPEPAPKRGTRRKATEIADEAAEEKPAKRGRKAATPEPQAQEEPPRRSGRRGASPQPEPEPKPVRGRKKAASPEPAPTQLEVPKRGRRAKADEVVVEISDNDASFAALPKRTSRSKKEATPEPEVPTKASARGRRTGKKAEAEPEAAEEVAPRATRGRAAKPVASDAADDEEAPKARTTRGRAATKVHSASEDDDVEVLSPSAADVPEGGKIDMILSEVHLGKHIGVEPSASEPVITTYSVATDPPTSIGIWHRLGTPLDQVGLQVWGGAMLLSDYLLANPKLVAGKTVLELGSGTGVVGIVAAKLCGASRVFLTDKGGAGVLELAQQNAEENEVAAASSPAAGSRRAKSKGPFVHTALVRELDWTDDSAPLYPVEHSEDDGPLPTKQPTDPRFAWADDEVQQFRDDCTVLLAADVAYDGFMTEMLVSRLRTLLQPAGRKRRALYLAMEKRPNFSLTGKVTVRAWEELEAAVADANESLAKHGLPGKPSDKKHRLRMERVEVDEGTVPKRFDYERTERMEIWRIVLEK
ncbi:hypothetical protein DFJ74DRAFT_670762 [Hyaloraphidium curvatum]|nr:hypothetical protein DFJ74DRAFT_670762 [Hyaloraphidium curvatum]